MIGFSSTMYGPLFFGLWIFALAIGITAPTAHADETKIPVTFSGGHETDVRDGGRPVVLVAAGLGVTPELFREAFSAVKPARDGKPSPDEARRNKAALLKVLSPHGVTNERLDEVSDDYRYQPQRGELWTNTPAKAYAMVEAGKFKQIVLTSAGSGYSSAPKATVEGMEGLQLKVTVQFGKDLEKNGAIGAVEIVPTEASVK